MKERSNVLRQRRKRGIKFALRKYNSVLSLYPWPRKGGKHTIGYEEYGGSIVFNVTRSLALSWRERERDFILGKKRKMHRTVDGWNLNSGNPSMWRTGVTGATI